MEPLFLITGIAGHVGTALQKELRSRGYAFRGLLYYSDPALPDSEKEHYVRGDVGDEASLSAFFASLEGREVYLIHLASLIDIKAKRLTPAIERVNVEGTKILFNLARRSGVKRFVYISSVDAFESARRHVDETSPLAPTDKRIGAYPISKSLATAFLKEKQHEGASVSILYPSAVLGPYDKGHNHMVQMVKDYCAGKIPGVIPGRYDVVDVRDLAKAIVDSTLLEQRPSDDSFILSGETIPLKDILLTCKQVRSQGHPVRVFPYFLAYLGLPFVSLHCHLHHLRPLYTSFALHLLQNANTFSHEKATREFGYAPRPISDTIRDTINDLYDLGVQE